MAGAQKTALEREERAARALNTFRQIVSTAKRQLVASGERSDLSGAQLWALSEVRKRPGLTVQDLAAAMSVHQSTASNLVEKLVAAEVIRKKRDALDKRIVRLHPTATGTQMLKKAPAARRGSLPEALDRMSDSELKALEASLLLLAEKIGQGTGNGSED